MRRSTVDRDNTTSVRLTETKTPKRATRKQSGGLGPSEYGEKIKDMQFTVNDKLLGDDAKMALVSLLDNIMKIGVANQIIELSTPFLLGEEYIAGKCQKCEFTVSYTPTSVCLAKSNTSTGSNKCKLEENVVKFFVRRENSNGIKEYIPIKVVRLINAPEKGLNRYTDNSRLDKLANESDIAFSQAQKDALHSIIDGKKLSEAQLSDLARLVDKLQGDIATGSKAHVANLLRNERVMSSVPTLSDVNTANAVAATLEKGKTLTLVPSNPLNFENDVADINVPVSVTLVRGQRKFYGGGDMMYLMDNEKVIDHDDKLADMVHIMDNEKVVELNDRLKALVNNSSVSKVPSPTNSQTINDWWNSMKSSDTGKRILSSLNNLSDKVGDMTAKAINNLDKPIALNQYGQK